MNSHRPARSAWLRLAISVAAIALVWLVLLPLVGRRWLAAEIEAEAARGIDPSAMFYTELEMMSDLLQHLESDRP